MLSAATSVNLKSSFVTSTGMNDAIKSQCRRLTAEGFFPVGATWTTEPSGGTATADASSAAARRRYIPTNKKSARDTPTVYAHPQY